MGQPSPPHERASAQSCPPRFLWQNPNILSPSFNFIVTSGVAAPLAISVEPHNADCVFRSVRAGDGRARAVDGDLRTMMAGLACGEVSTLAWEILREHLFAAAACPDGEAPLAILASPAFGGRGQELTVVSGGPDVVAVEVDYLSGFDLPLRLKTARREAPEDQCFFFTLEDPYHGLPLNASPSACFRVRCYDADGKLLYESPYPARWLEYPILDSHLKVVTP